jgi:hypothetical protein
VSQSVFKTLDQLLDGRRLIASRLHFTDKFKFFAHRD